MKLIERIHGRYIFERRVSVLSRQLSELIPRGASVLDVGCGDGYLAHHITRQRPDVQLTGIDVLVREHTWIPVREFDGCNLPFPDNGVDLAMFVDVLHHTDDPVRLLAEAMRVTRVGILLKDHTLEGLLAEPTLRFMDDIGNARHGVRLPYHYWRRSQWLDTFADLGLEIEQWNAKPGIYRPPLEWFFGRSLHFIAVLKPRGATSIPTVQWKGIESALPVGR